MSLFEVLRGFFGVPGSHYRGGNTRDSFFDGLSHEEDDDEEEDGFHHGDFDDMFRFGFSFGPNGVRVHEPNLFGQIFQDMEDVFASLGHFGPGLPSIEAPCKERPEEDRRRRGRNGHHLRDFMLKSPDVFSSNSPSVAPKHVDPSPPDDSSMPKSPFHHWSPLPKFKGIWRSDQRGREDERKEDRDLDSQVSSGGLDQILTPTPSQPKTHSFFQSITVVKVVKPDGTVEERRTVRDGQGNEETTVVRSGDLGGQEGPRDESNSHTRGPFSDLHDESSLFTKIFGGLRR